MTCNSYDVICPHTSGLRTSKCLQCMDHKYNKLKKLFFDAQDEIADLRADLASAELGN